MALFNQLLDAQKRFQLALLAKAGVVGVGVGYRDEQGEATDELAIVALVEQKKPIEALDPQDLVPRELEGARTDVYEVGVLRAQNIGPRDRWRPVIPSGVSVGHPLVTAGTLGAMVRDTETGERLIVSNNHVLANSNAALVGDPVLQPAATDGGERPDDVVGTLLRFNTLRFIGETTPTPDPGPDPDPSPDPGTPPSGGGSGCDITDAVVAFGNLLARLNGSDKRLTTTTAAALETQQAVDPIRAQAAIPTNPYDCALARPSNPAMFSDEILEIGRISGTMSPQLGMQIRKTGRTTGTTQGVVNLLNATVDVSYSTARGLQTARFTGQCIASGMSQGGDSGSLIVAKDSTQAVGLLFAGSGISTIFTPIETVLRGMNITF